MARTVKCPGCGITPAWAGKSVALPALKLAAVDHPRVGGEKPPVSMIGCTTQGSPPRGRGKDLVNDFMSFLFGITPAWAGKRNQTEGNRRAKWDHPRVGGEKLH